MTIDQDTQPMTLPDIQIVPDDWPTERLPRTGSGARHTTPTRSGAVKSTLIWGAFVLLCASALGGGVWFSTTANAGLATPAVTTSATTTVSTSAPGVITIPTATATSSAPHTDARRAAVAAPADTGSIAPTPASTSSAAPTDTSTGDVLSTGTGGVEVGQPGNTTSAAGVPTTSSPSPATTPPPSPVGTQPISGDPGCVNVTYSDGSVRRVCTVNPNPSGSAS